MASVQKYIGYPGYQFNNASGEARDIYQKHLNDKMVIAEIKPLKQQATGDANIYEGVDAWSEFNTCLSWCKHDTAGVENQTLRLVISKPVSVSESFDNLYKDSELLSGLGNGVLGSKGTELAFMTGAKDTNDIEKMLKESGNGLGELLGKGAGLYNKGINGLRSASESLGKSNNAFSQAASKILDTGAKVANSPWSKINWPQMWSNCSYRSTYDLNCRLYCYHCKTTTDYDNNIRAALAALQLFVAPQSKDGILYTWPFMMDFKIDGVIHMPLAFCNNLQVIKGGDEADFAANGRPNIIDIRMNIQNAYSIMLNAEKTSSKQRPLVSTDSAELAAGKKTSLSGGDMNTKGASSSSNQSSQNIGRRAATSAMQTAQKALASFN